MRNHKVAVNTGGVRRDTLDGREHLVVPVRAVEEGVLDGGFLPAETIAASEPGWNGVPAVAGHPTDGNSFISANQPEIHDNLTFGTLFGAEADSGELTAELWLDIEKARSLEDDGFEVAADAIEKLEAGEDVSVSTSYIPTERVESPGHYDGQPYQHRLEAIQPDHIGILPNGNGRDPSAQTLVANSMRSITNTLGTVLSHATPNRDGSGTVRANISESQFVQWDWSNGTAYGQVVETVSEGERSVDGNTRTVEAGDGEKIAVIEQLNEDGEPQNQRVLKLVRDDGENENNLRAWDAPEQARANADSDTMVDIDQLTIEDHIAPWMVANTALDEDGVAAFFDAISGELEAEEAANAMEMLVGVTEIPDEVQVMTESGDGGSSESGSGASGSEGDEDVSANSSQTDFSARVAANRSEDDGDTRDATFGSYSSRRNADN